MEYFQNDEMYSRIMKRYFTQAGPKFIKVQKGKKKKREQPKGKKQVQQKIELPKDLDKAIEFKRDFNKSFPDTYDPQFVEQCWNEWWTKKKFFSISAEQALQVPHNKRYVNILPPPNVTGKLHIGHALTGSIEDSLVRWKRMKGYKVAYVPGVDHAGIATQSVVEKMLARQNISKYDLGREKFLEKVWEWKEEYGNFINNQMRKLGCSFDWDRYFFTLDDTRAKAVMEAFVNLHDKKLIYRANRLINWSCKLSTAISNIEVDTKDIPGFTKLKVPGYDKVVEFGVMIDFAYKVKDSDEEIVVSTTRLETMLGDVAVAVSSKDERYKHLVGKKLQHPFIKDRDMVVVIDDELVDMEFGTGAVKITPAHDPNDFMCGKKNNLEFINILTNDGKINENGGKYVGMKRYDVRYQLQKDLEELGLYRGKKKNPMSLQFCSRSGDVIEPLLKPQWYVNCQEIKQKMLDVVADKELVLHPDNHVKVWNHYMNNLEDWCISRQLWWGHRIPAYKMKLENGEFYEENDQIVWVSGQSYDIALEKAKKVCNLKFELVQDEDVLDTWFSSALLPFSCFNWPDKNSEEFKAFFPNHVLETGYDILFFWVAKMVMMSLMLCDKLPFTDVILHNIVRDEEGRKMSKSLGNVIDPLQIINGCELNVLVEKIKNSMLSQKEKDRAVKNIQNKFKQGIPACGSDALRYSLLSLVNHNKDINLDLNIPVRDRRFGNKIWNSYKLVRQLIPNDFKYIPVTEQTIQNLNAGDKWILYQFNNLLEVIEDGFSTYKFGNAIEMVSYFYMHDFCDFYLEYSKCIQKSTNDQSKQGNQQTLFYILENFLRLLHPVMPFLSEELYQKLPQFDNKNETISLSPFPLFQKFLNQENYQQFELVNELISEIRKQLAILNLSKGSNPPIQIQLIDNSNDSLKKILEESFDYIKFLSKTGQINWVENKQDIPKEVIKGNVQGKIDFYAYVKGLVNASDNINKLNKQIVALQQQIDKLEKKMNSDGYAKKVPDNVQQRERDTLEKNKMKLTAYQQSKKIFENLV